jgi:hypothetical protein
MTQILSGPTRGAAGKVGASKVIASGTQKRALMRKNIRGTRPLFRAPPRGAGRDPVLRRFSACAGFFI